MTTDVTTETDRDGSPKAGAPTGVAREVGLEVAIFVAVFAVASLVGALIWKSIVDLPRWTQTGHGLQGVNMGAIEGVKTVGIDAGYLFVSAPIALVIGAALMFWRQRRPGLTVSLIAFASVGAAALMERLGLIIGPADPAGVLRSAAVGVTAPTQLQVQSSGVLLAWPTAAVLGALLVLLLLPTAPTPPLLTPVVPTAGLPTPGLPPSSGPRARGHEIDGGSGPSSP